MSTSSRGASVLAAISFVALLGIALIGLEVLSPANSTSQTAAVVAAPALTTQSKLNPQQICEAKKKEALGKDQSDDPDPQPYKKGDTNIAEKNACVGAVFDTSKAATAPAGSDPRQNVNNYKCVGESTTVNIQKNGQGTIDSEVDATVEAGTCKAKFCDDSGNCTPEKKVSGVQGIQSWALDKTTFASMSPDQQKEVLGYGPIPASQQSQLQQAFQQQQSAMGAASSAVTQQCGATPDNSCQATINQQIAQQAGLNCLNANASAAGCVVNGGDATRALAANQQDLNQQMKQLAQAQVFLDPTSAGGCPGSAGCPGNPNGGNPNVTNPNTTNPNGNNNPNTFGNGSGGGSGGGSSNPLSSLLNGLAKGLSTPTPPPAPPPAPAQACSTDPNAYAQQQQQYQTQLQQYNYQLQQYNYQLQVSAQQGSSIAAPIPPQQPTPCAPSTQNQCTTQPQQPAASTCTGSTWQPVYAGSCITNWQCGGAAGTATLSCQPQVADVGMSIAVSYSCSSGTATGNGFTASGQSGTSTITVTTPPQGTNTATYSLSCNNNGQTSGAQCSVQVGTPSIILVANPKTVQAGQTSQIGWITTGMQSCVISSPDQPDFTSQNSSNTSVNGTVTSMPVTTTASFLLHCQTVAGGVKDAMTTVQAQ